MTVVLSLGNGNGTFQGAVGGALNAGSYTEYTDLFSDVDGSIDLVWEHSSISGLKYQVSKFDVKQDNDIIY